MDKRNDIKAVKEVQEIIQLFPIGENCSKAQFILKWGINKN